MPPGRPRDKWYKYILEALLLYASRLGGLPDRQPFTTHPCTQVPESMRFVELLLEALRTIAAVLMLALVSL